MRVPARPPLRIAWRKSADDVSLCGRGSTTKHLRGEALAALLAARRNDGAAGAGAHTGTEAVLAGTTTVIGLESTLALGHGTSLLNIH